MAMAVPGPFVGVVVDSGLHLGRPRLLAVPMGVRLPAGVRLVAVPMAVRLPAAAQLVACLGAGAMAVADGAGERPSRGRLSVRAAAAGNGVSSVVLPVHYASSGAGLFFGSAASSGVGLFFGSGAASSLALAAGSRAPAGPGVPPMVASASWPPRPASFPADGEDGDDPTPAEIDEEQWFKDKAEWMKEGEKYILGCNAEEEMKQIKNREQWMKDGEKYIAHWKWNAEKAQAQTGFNKFQEWLLLPRVDGASEKEEETATITKMFSAEHILKLIRDFNPELESVATDTSLVCKEKGLIDFFGIALFYGASHLELFMRTYNTTSENYEVLVSLGKELKVAATECQRGYLQAESLDTALLAMIRLMGLPVESLDPFGIRVRLLQRRGREFAVDDTEKAMIYFIIMAAYTQDVMMAVIKEMYEISVAAVLHCKEEEE